MKTSRGLSDKHQEKTTNASPGKYSNKPSVEYSAASIQNGKGGGLVDPLTVIKALGSPPLVRGERGFRPLFRALFDELKPLTFSQAVIVYDIAHLMLLTRRSRKAGAGLLESNDMISLTPYYDPELPDFVRGDQEPPKREVVRVSTRRIRATPQSLGNMLIKNIEVIERNHAMIEKMDHRRDQLIEALRREQKSKDHVTQPILDLDAIDVGGKE
jgi:hypothetical protein